jgi:hypothetical protein
VTAVLDVHPPHTPTHGWRDFFIHLFTITIGLLIALSLEGLVEWQHHRHLVHEAEANMTSEIRINAEGMQEHLKKLHDQQAELAHDMDTLGAMRKTRKLPADKHMSVTYTITSFDDVSWKTAQATGALAYMPYGHARDYSTIYDMQTKLTELETTAGHDAAVAVSSFYDFDDDKVVPTPEKITPIMDRIAVLEGQLLIVDSFTKGLASHYDKFLKAHPGTE